MNKLDRDIGKLEKQEAIIRQRLIQLRANKNKEIGKLLLRKRIALGAFILEKMKHNEDYADEIIAELNKSLDKPKERELFNLKDTNLIVETTKKQGLIKY